MAKRSKNKFPITDAKPDDPIFSRGFVIGGRVRRASPASPSKRKIKTTPAPPDHPIFSRGFVIGGRVRKASPAISPKPKDARGRGQPHRYPWIDSTTDPRPKTKSSKDTDR